MEESVGFYQKKFSLKFRQSNFPTNSDQIVLTADNKILAGSL